MSKIKLTKGELKRQRDSLKQFQHYLPTLQLKKQQLQMKILEARQKLAERQKALEEKESFINRWVGLLADPLLAFATPGLDFKKWLTPQEIKVEQINIAGARISIFKDITFSAVEYDYYTTPLWVDHALVELRAFVAILAEMSVINRQIAILQQELRVTTQRVNLFEKIKIPESRNNIRIIRIYLGDQQANAVGISKVAKGKISNSLLEEMAII